LSGFAQTGFCNQSSGAERSALQEATTIDAILFGFFHTDNLLI
jgi:hypothetical protein